MKSSNQELRCPQDGCNGHLTPWGTCKQCEVDWADYFKEHDTSDTMLIKALQSGWAAHDTSQHTLVLLGYDYGRDYEVPWRGLSNTALCEVRNQLITDGNFPRSLTLDRMRSFMSGHARRSDEELGIPTFESRGDYPGLFLSQDTDTLYWPFAVLPAPLCRIHEKLYYTGTPFAPQHTGAFEEFLSTVRCRSEGDRDALRGWMLGSLLTRVIGVGGASPLLVLSANENSVGKTKTAQVLGALFGGCVDVTWTERLTEDDLTRRLIDPSKRLLLLDNVTPGGNPVFESDLLSKFITATHLNTKRLFYSTGGLTRPNHVLFVATMNVPRLASDLLARAAICELSRHTPRHKNWESVWIERRIDVLQDMMAICVDGWAQGPVEFPTTYRFLNWWNAVSRVLRRPPTMVPEGCTVRSPVDLALDDYLHDQRVQGRVRLSDFVLWCNEARFGVANHVRTQTPSSDRIRFELESYVGHYEVFEEEDDIWVRPRGTN